jgi:branched-chain amino acid transport system substrate-binding protein
VNLASLALAALLAQQPPAPAPSPVPDAPRHYGNAPEGMEAFARTPAVYRRFFTTVPEFDGAGRDEPEPTGLKEVKLGIITTLTGRGGDAGRAMRDGVLLALDDENAAGGLRGLPFRLVERDDHGPWGASSNELVRLYYDEQVFAVFGSSEATSIHVALRVALKLGMPMISTGCSDPTVTETGIPWIIRTFPDDRQNAYRLASWIYEACRHASTAVVRVNDKYGRMGIGEFIKASRRLGHAPPLEIRFLPGDRDFHEQIAKVAASGADAVYFLGAAEEGGLFVRQLRAAGVTLPVYGHDLLVSPRFLELAGPAAEGVVVTTPVDPQRSDAPYAEFRRRFAARFGYAPDEFALYGYGGARIVAAAVRKAGLNRARIRDALYEPASYETLAGTIRLDPTRNCITPALLTRVEHGAFSRAW